MNKVYKEDFGFFQPEETKINYIRFNLNALNSHQIQNLTYQSIGFNSCLKERDENRVQ